MENPMQSQRQTYSTEERLRRQGKLAQTLRSRSELVQDSYTLGLFRLVGTLRGNVKHAIPKDRTFIFNKAVVNVTSLSSQHAKYCIHTMQHGYKPTLRQMWSLEIPRTAIGVQEVDVQCVLQFTLSNAASCALHRRTSRVIHRLQLSKIFQQLSSQTRGNNSYCATCPKCTVIVFFYQASTTVNCPGHGRPQIWL